MTYAVIEDGKVVNVVDAPEGFDGIRIDHLDLVPGIGWSYDGETFAPADIVPKVPQRRLTKKQFIDRLTPVEYGTIFSHDDNPLVKGWIAYFTFLTPDPDGTSVDLDDPQTRKGLEDMAELVPQFTAERIAQIIA